MHELAAALRQIHRTAVTTGPEIVSEILTRILIGESQNSRQLTFTTLHQEDDWLHGIRISIDASDIALDAHHCEITGAGILAEPTGNLFRFSLFCRIREAVPAGKGMISAFRASFSRGDLAMEFVDLAGTSMDLLFEIRFEDRLHTGTGTPSCREIGYGKGYLFFTPMGEISVH